MARRGAFGLAHPASRSTLFISNSAARMGERRSLSCSRMKPSGCRGGHFDGLINLLSQFRDPETPYPPRPFPKFAKSYNAYDHLARVKEWSLGGEREEGA